LLPILRDWPFDLVLSHNRFTLVNRSAASVMDLAAARGIAFLNAAPFAGGVLAKGSATVRRITYQDADDAALAPIRSIEAICQRDGVAPGALALQFSMRESGVTSTVVGVSRPDRVAQTLDWASQEIARRTFDEGTSAGYSSEDPEVGRVYVPG
ncbi:MAG: aldo/keto reductase, partial [Paracoccaceae bacterium]